MCFVWHTIMCLSDNSLYQKKKKKNLLADFNGRFAWICICFIAFLSHFHLIIPFIRFINPNYILDFWSLNYLCFHLISTPWYDIQVPIILLSACAIGYLPIAAFIVLFPLAFCSLSFLYPWFDLISFATYTVNFFFHLLQIQTYSCGHITVAAH